MDFFVITPKIKNCQIKIASLDLNSKITLNSFPETFLVDKFLNSVLVVVTRKSKICEILEINLITGETQHSGHLQQDIAVFLEFIDTRLINRLLRRLDSFLARCNFFKNTILRMAKQNCLDKIEDGALEDHHVTKDSTTTPYSSKKALFSEISTPFFIIKRICTWPTINQEIVKASEYMSLILKKSLINELLAYMTPLTWSTYVRDLRTHNLVKEFMPTSQKIILSLLYNTGIYKTFLITNIMKYFTMRCGTCFDATSSGRVIAKFTKSYGIDMEECEQTKFRCFNDFFTRKLKPGARKIETPGKMSSPADCRILGCSGTKFEIKGRFFTISQLLNRDIDYKSVLNRDVDYKSVLNRDIDYKSVLNRDIDYKSVLNRDVDYKSVLNRDVDYKSVLNRDIDYKSVLNRDVDYKSVCICRLAPQDYHRFHAPLPCEVVSIRNIEGLYHSVHPICRSKQCLDENMRTVIELKTDRGMIYYVAIGAMLVGSICLSVGIGSKLDQMDEIGYFKFGGSCIVMITDFEWNLRDEIAGNTLLDIETIVKVGDCIED